MSKVEKTVKGSTELFNEFILSYKKSAVMMIMVGSYQKSDLAGQLKNL